MRKPIFVVFSIERTPPSPGWILINGEWETREEALVNQQWAEYVAGEVAWIEEKK